MLSKQQICNLIPHRDPFLWIDEVTDLSDTRIIARKHIAAELDLFRGHYPGKPVLPGVMLCEAAMQAGAVLVAHAGTSLPAGHVPVATRLNNVKFKHMVRPGDTLEIEVELTEKLTNAYFLSARVRVAGRTAAQFDFACAVVPAE